MKPLGTPSSPSEARAEAALARWADLVGEAPRYAPLVPSVMMPMHMAGDAIPYAVTPTGAEAPSLLVKVYERDMPAGLDLAATAAASRQAAALGLAPALLAESLEHEALLFSLLPASRWRPAMRQDFERSSLKPAALAAKRAWHRGAPLRQSRSPFERIERLFDTIRAMEASHALRPPQGYATLQAWIRRIEQALAAAGCACGPIHGENTMSNIMVGEDDRVLLVDFDRAVNADPHYDLGAFCSEFCAFEDEVAEAVALYLGAPDPRVTARAQLYMIVDDVLWGCWSLIAHHSCARSQTVEFYKYAQNRFLRARYWLGRWDVDGLLRRI